MDVEGSQKPEQDPNSRRSSRKRRKINYKPNDTVKLYVPHIPKAQRNDKRRGRPRKITCLPEIEVELKPKQLLKKKKKLYCLDEIDKMIVDFIELGDKTSIQRLIAKLQNSLKQPAKVGQKEPKAKIIEETATEEKDVSNVTDQTSLSNNFSSNADQTSPVLPVLQSASSIPANLQTKSISVHGNNVIMQGVIDTGMAQQSCFLIPIDINNISRFPGSAVQVIHSPQSYMSNSQQLMSSPATTSNTTQLTTQLTTHQASVVSHPAMCNAVDNSIQIINPGISFQSQQLPIVIPSNNSAQNETVQSESQGSDKIPTCSSNDVSQTNTITYINSSNSLEDSPMPTIRQNIENNDITEKKLMPVIEIDEEKFKDMDGFSNSPSLSKKGDQSKRICVPSTINQMQQNQRDETVPSTSESLQTKKPDNSAVIESLLEALQSTNSLPEIIDQLSQEEMLAIMEILNPNTPTQSLGNHTNNTFNGDVTSSVTSSHSTNCNNTVPNDNNSLSLAPQSLGLSTDLEKLAGDLERLSKLDIDTLPSGTVNQLASEMSKVLLGGGLSEDHIPHQNQDHIGVHPEEEDQDFHHVQIPQYLSREVVGGAERPPEPPPAAVATTSTASFRCYICGMTCQDDKTFISHMRFHLFKHRYSCYECGYGTSSMNELLLHKANDHEGDLTKISPDFLRQLPKLEKSSDNSDLEDTLITCPECKQNIPLHSLGPHMTQAHKSIHKASPGRKPKCTICTALVDNKAELAAHVNHHAKVENCFSCYFCSQTFTSISCLQLHTTNQHATLAARRHYKCTQCSREFSGSYHLIRHVKTVHEQRRDYQCSKCDKSFVELHCLRRHIRNIHNLIRDHTCPVCNRGFTYRQDMFRHIMSVHQKIRDIKCPLCNEKFYHRYFIGHAYRQHALKVKYRDGICYIYDDAGNVIHKIT